MVRCARLGVLLGDGQPLPVRASVPRTVSVPPLIFTSLHRSTRASPCRRPVKAIKASARAHLDDPAALGSSVSAFAASKRASAWSTL